jgi:fibronectin type 3 domain-containing protein
MPLWHADDFIRTLQEMSMQYTFIGRTVLKGLILAVIMALVAGPRSALAATYTVTTLADTGAGSLREAITSANGDSGSTVNFQSGLTGTITLSGPLPQITGAMTILGPGAATITINAGSLCRPFWIDASGATVSISGLTITNGHDAGDLSGGSGIRIDAGSVSLTNCTLSGNASAGYGGAIFNWGTLTMTGCTVSNNTTVASGGGLCNFNTATATNCTFSGNTSNTGGPDTGGGGVYNADLIVGPATLTLSGCTLSSNTALYGGGLLNNGTGTVIVTGCTISNNNSGANGGGVWNNKTITLTDCTLSGNHTGDGGGYGGGGLYTNGGATVTNCVISGNASYSGGGVFLDDFGGSFTMTLSQCTLTNNTAWNGAGFYNSKYHGDASVLNMTNCSVFGNVVQISAGAGVNEGLLTAMNCTFTANEAPSPGAGGLITGNNGTSTVTNCILYFDAPTGAELTGGGTINATYSDVQGGFSGTGNINADPQFVTSTSDLHLAISSPCLQTGTATGAPPVARDGATRPNPPSIGAYEVKSPPAAPTGLIATPGNAKATLSWTASSGASFYNVKRAAVSGGPYTTVASPTTTSYVNTGLTNGTTYFYVVSAVNAGGEGANSAQASATLPPPAPTGLTATPADQQVSLSWSAAATATAYRVRRGTVSGGPYSTIATLTATNWVNTGLTNGTTYYYVVAGTSPSGDGPSTAQVSATPFAVIPPAPTGLTAKAGDTKVTLQWTAASGATLYRIRRGTVSGGPYTTIASVTNTIWANTGLANGTTYYYVVAGSNSAGTSPNSTQAGATPAPLPAQPTGLSATPGNAKVTLSWSAVPGVTGYRIRRSTVSGGPYAALASVGGTTYANVGLTNGTTYYYVVAGFNAIGDGPYTPQVSATPN